MSIESRLKNLEMQVKRLAERESQHRVINEETAVKTNVISNDHGSDQALILDNMVDLALMKLGINPVEFGGENL